MRGRTHSRVYVNAWPGKNRDAPAASHKLDAAAPVRGARQGVCAVSLRTVVSGHPDNTIPLEVRQRLDSVVIGLW